MTKYETGPQYPGGVPGWDGEEVLLLPDMHVEVVRVRECGSLSLHHNGKWKREIEV